MILTLDALQILDAIERRGSFAAAANELNRVPSALTYSVRKLEDDLDVLLFDRSGKRAKLTIAGRELLDEGRHLLRSVGELEQRVKRVATGWEVQLRIAYSELFDFSLLAPLLERFWQCEAQAGVATQIKLSAEVLGGTWDALAAGRADLAIGATEDFSALTGRETLRLAGHFQTRPFGEVEFIFCVAPQHPLAQVKEPLSLDLIRQYRSVAVADTSRLITPRSVGIAPGQDVLTVPTMQAKLQAQIRGLGCGWLPRRWAQAPLQQGQLIEKSVQAPRAATPLYLAWAAPARGLALKFWLKMLAEPAVQNQLLRLVP